LEAIKFSVIFAQVRQTIPKSTWAEIRTAFASGIGLREIARHMGIAEGTVLARAKRKGWTRQIQSAKALAKREETQLTITPVEAVAISSKKRDSDTSNAWRASQSVALTTSKQWTASKYSTPSIKSKNSTR
jgi:hypothetical protein